MSRKKEARRQLWRTMAKLHKKSAELSKALPVVVQPPTPEDPTVQALRKMVRLGRAYNMVVR